MNNNFLSLGETFLEEVTNNHLSLATPARKLVFQLRFNPEFHPQNGIDGRNNQEIANMVKNQLDENVGRNISVDLKWVVRKLAEVFEAEMKKDGVDVKSLRASEKGRRPTSPWMKVYEWLWQKHYPRWFLQTKWQELVNRANKYTDWLQVELSENQSRDFKKSKSHKATIPLKTDVLLIVNLKSANDHLLILNQGTSGEKYCMCPSQDFAPSRVLCGEQMTLPQIGAKYEILEFETVGEEQFLAILTKEPLDLKWLHPNSEEPVPSLDATRIYDLCEQLEKQNSQELFYASLEVA